MKCRGNIILWTVLALLLTGCHFFEDAENVDECALNSGYPCPCVPNAAHFTCKDKSGDYCCEDGRSTCVYTTEINENRGICTLPCTGVADTQSCIRTQGFGSQGLCAMLVNQSTTPNYCELVCDPEIENCSPGMECRTDLNTSFSVCRPEIEL